MTDHSPTQEFNREEPVATSSLLRTRIQWTGLIGGPALALMCYALLPTSYENGSGETVAFLTGGRATLAVMVWMATWWITEALDVSITALLPIGLFPILGIATIRAACAPYAHELIFLFMGGFLLALSMQRWGLDRRIALITLRLVGTKPVNMVGGFMLATAGLSAFVSNTATTAMMLPIAMSVIDLVLRDKTDGQGRNFALCLMLGVAYAASIGGVATIIGTPPNVFLIGFIKDQYDVEISFVQWLGIGLPLTIVFLPLTWLLLTRVLYPIRLREIEGGEQLIASQYALLGPVNRGQWVTFIVFTLTALSWICRPLLQKVTFSTSGGDVFPLAGLTDTGIVMIAAMLLFMIPVNIKQRIFTMNWETATKLPWGILILFGGGLSLAGAVKANGVAEFIGAQIVAFANMPNILVILLVVTMMIFLTELTSNTATTATLIPILAGLAVALGIDPFMLIVPATIAASYAFMMPVATPPNAIVFGSGHVTIAQMCKAGLGLNIIGIMLITILMYTIAAPLLRVP